MHDAIERPDRFEWSEPTFDDLLATARAEILTLAHPLGHAGGRANASLGSLAPPNAVVLWLSASPPALAAALACAAPFVPVARVDDASFVARALSAAHSSAAPILVERRLGRRTPASPTAPARVLLDLIDAVVVAARRGLRVVQFPMAGAEYLGLDRRAADEVASPAKVVRELSAMLAHLGIPVAIENPCVDMTSEEILRAVTAHDAAALLSHTISCAMPGGRAAGHCGACLSCFERRGAVLRLGLEAHDPSAGYARDPFTGARDTNAEDIAATLIGLDPGQVADRDAVLAWSSAASLLPGDFAHNVDRVVRLWQRRAAELSRALDVGLAVHAQALRRGELPRRCLLVDLVLAAYRDRDSGLPHRPLLRPAGDVWEARFTGSGSTFLPRARGFEYLRVLLARPHVAVSALELRELRCGSGAPAALDLATGADDEARAAYRARLIALRDLRKDAEEDRDLGRLERIDEEVSALEQELSRTLGLGGRPRPTGDAERARKAISNAIRASITLLERHLPEMATHLAASIRTGRYLAYEPSSPLAWET